MLLYLKQQMDSNDDLRYHEMIANDKNFKTIVTPGFRPYEMFALNTPKFYNFFENYKKM